MPPLETADRYQRAVLWPWTGYGDDGRPTVDEANPQELLVRWTWKRTEAVNSQGQPIATDATVVVGREVALGSRMWEGALADWLGTGSAGEANYVMEAVLINETPDIRNRAVRIEVGLAFYKDTPG